MTEIAIDGPRQAILDAAGHCLVLGGPGSGKTTIALLKALTRIEKVLSPGQEILFLSFSRAAVARITDAIKKDIPLAQRSLLSVQTFHSFFWSILRTHGHLLGAPKTLSIVLAHDDKALRNGIDQDDLEWPLWVERRELLFKEEGRVCFDLFAPLAAQLLTQAMRIRDRVCKRFPLILVDEAQDTGEHQWECIKLLGDKSQIVCLADPDQMIFDYLPGVGPERVEQIRQFLKPLEIDLGGENHRSPGTEIVAFARDVLSAKVRNGGYQNVTKFQFGPKAEQRDLAIRQSLGILSNAIRKATGAPPKSIGVIASYSIGVAIVSAALRRDKPIPHQVLFDESFVLLASRIGAFLLEPKRLEDRHIAEFLELYAAALRAKGGQTALSEAAKMVRWAKNIREGKIPAVKLVAAIAKVLELIEANPHLGDPRRDWTRVKNLLRQSGSNELELVAEALDYLVAFNRGERIASGLLEGWLDQGAYVAARAVLDQALTEDQLLADSIELNGIHVMNMHKCKGKQFDGVIIFRHQYNSPFVWKNDPAPHLKSRRVLHVAITRARSHVLILNEALSKCPILNEYKL